MVPSSGGFVICRPKPILFKHAGFTQGLTLCSDIHIGAPQVDLKLFQKELETAQKHKDRILINGDLLDLIIVKDFKRFSPDALHPRLQGRKDIINEAIKWAIEILSPYAHLIDMIGVGNHESVVEKYSSFDPTSAVVYELNQVASKQDKSHVIHHGGYTGYVDYRLNNGNQHGIRYVVFYTHGVGGTSSPVTKGMIDFHRKDTFVDADLIWMGHKHNKWTASLIKISCPDRGFNPTMKEVRHVLTGAYFDTYVGQTQEDIRAQGRRTNYAADAAMAPQGKGGMRVELEVQGSRIYKGYGLASRVVI